MTIFNAHNISFSKLWRLLAALAIVVALLATFQTSPSAHDDDDDDGHGKKHRGVITGKVTDPSGKPIKGAVVSIKKGPATVTDAGGGYTLNEVKQEKRIIVRFSKAGFVPTQGITSLKTQGRENNNNDNHHHNDDDDDDGDHDDDDGDHDDDRGRSRKLDRVTLSRTMLPSGSTQTLNTSVTNTIAEEGFKVTFPAGSLKASGAVKVIVSPIDVSTNELQAFPGDFNARSRTGRAVLLETFSLMEITILQNGQAVDLKHGKQATLEFLLPSNTSLTAGQTIPLWYFDEEEGLWIEDGRGTVGVSSFNAARLSVVGQVKHFTWWNVDRPIEERTCLTGTVLDVGGSPVPGASVLAWGIDYNGSSTAVTNADGEYCITVKRGSQVRVTASAFNGMDSSASVIINTPVGQFVCGQDPCGGVPLLLLPPASCVSGDVKDGAGNPVAGVTVTSSTGAFATTTATGAYCLRAPAGSSVSVFASGFNSTTVTTFPIAGACATGGCAVAPIRPPGGGNPEACLRIAVTNSTGSPAAAANVTVISAQGSIIAQGTTDANGILCLSGLPVNVFVSVQVIDSQGQSGSNVINTGSGGGSCASGGCVLVPVITGAPADA